MSSSPLHEPVWRRSTRQRREHAARIGDPAEDPALRLDHREAHGVELGKVGRAAVARHDAAVAAIVGLAHGRVHADLGRDAAHDQRVDAAVAQELVQVGREERALARLVDDGLARDAAPARGRCRAPARREPGCAPSGPARRCAASARRARPWRAARRRDRDDGLRACGRPACRGARAASSSARHGATAAASSDTSLPSVSPKPPGSRKSRCMSMMTSAVARGSIAIGSGLGVHQDAAQWLGEASRQGRTPSADVIGAIALVAPSQETNQRHRMRALEAECAPQIQALLRCEHAFACANARREPRQLSARARTGACRRSRMRAHQTRSRRGTLHASDPSVQRTSRRVRC